MHPVSIVRIRYRNATQRKNVAKKIGKRKSLSNAFFSQIRKCRRRVGGIAERCVALRNDGDRALLSASLYFSKRGAY